MSAPINGNVEKLIIGYKTFDANNPNQKRARTANRAAPIIQAATT